MNIIRTRRRRQWLRFSAFTVIGACAALSAILLSYVGVESYLAMTALR